MTTKQSKTKTQPSSNSADEINKYDLVEYDSHPYNQSHPEHMYTIGRLFGMKPQDFSNARVLELGCASGGNLYPLALNFPNSQFVGVDLSKKQIEHGTQIVKELGLKNIELKHMSILDIDEKLGKFDYIICHGIFSWVPENVRQKIIEVFSTNLSAQGIAYISYNTLPGWNMVRSIREMMLYHSQNFATPQEKATQARCMLQFIVDGLEGDESPYANFLRSEVKLLSQQQDYYLLHDHLEDVNHPVYFSEMISMCNANNLSYLSDVDVSLMYPLNLTEKVSQELVKINDIVRTEQYMDFLRNRRFRGTLVCPSSVTLNRSLDPSVIENFYLSTPLKFNENFQESQLDAGVELSFQTNGLTFRTTDRLSKIALKVLIDCNGKPISYGSLCKKIMAASGENNLETIKNHLRNHLNIVRLFLAGIVQIHSSPRNYSLEVANKPVTTPLVRLQARTNALVTNQRHQCVRVNDFEKVLIQYLDGKHTIEGLNNKVKEHVAKGELNIQKDGKPIEDEALKNETIQNAVKETLNSFAINAMLLEEELC